MGVLDVGNLNLETPVWVGVRFSVTALHSLCVSNEMETRTVWGDVTKMRRLREIMTHTCKMVDREQPEI